MRNLIKRSFALVLVLVICISLIPAISFDADAAGGSYVYNWGTRGVVATSLSQSAINFYNENVSYEVLASYSGGTSSSNVPNSAMYKALQNLMKDNHSYITSYNATKELFQYTDCQNGGGKISSFYSGNAIGPSWDGGSSWNREHTWPNSKGLGGSDENDLMMLRPTSTSENSSRGNKAYGKSSGYYNPNSESNGAYDLRGDVARIFLYVYVRWGNNSHAWGSGGVMESADVMLEWMEADPVDTWELGRNDSVESITGTRNVFVDYPELAFLLFGEEVPADMTTPSGIGGNGCDHNNFDAGVVTPPTCESKGYTLYTCQTSGCGYSYKAEMVNATGHNYASGSCTVCGASEPQVPKFVTEITVGKAYKLGLFSTAKNAEYYFNGTMSGYYGATDTAYDNGVDVYVQNATGGYYLYFINSSGVKQYINLVTSGSHYNFTYGDAASSVFTWDSEKSAFHTPVSGEACYMGNFGTYVTVNVLRSSSLTETDYIARMYTFGEGNDTPDNTCEHSYTTSVTSPSCTNGGYTTNTCSLCGHSYKSNLVAATGHNYVNGTCTVCGDIKSNDPTWVLTDISDIKPTDIVVITVTRGDGTTFAMLNSNGSGAAPTPPVVVIDGNKLSGEIADNLKWNITNNNGSLTICPNGDSSKWLYCNSANNGVRVGTESTGTFKIDETTGYLFNVEQSRYIGVYNAQDWRCYTSVHANIANQRLGFFVYTAPTSDGDSTGGNTGGGSTTPDNPTCEHQSTATTTVEPKCTVTGTTTVTCNDCGATLSTTEIPATDKHTYGDWEITREATEEKSGMQVRRCEECGNEEIGFISFQGTNDNNTAVVTTVVTVSAVSVTGGVGVAIFFILRKRRPF